jgi:hypothetical protein
MSDTILSSSSKTNDNLLSLLTGNVDGPLGEECRRYATHLCSLSLTQLHQEPTVLERSELQLAGQTQDLLCSNYGAVIASAQITAHVQTGLNQVDQCLTSIDSQLPSFTHKLTEFSEEAKHIAKR